MLDFAVGGRKGFSASPLLRGTSERLPDSHAQKPSVQWKCAWNGREKGVSQPWSPGWETRVESYIFSFSFLILDSPTSLLLLPSNIEVEGVLLF